LIPFSFFAQVTVEDWNTIKEETSIEVMSIFIDVYDQPLFIELSDYGWEDGLQISQDGLNLYALYSPSDFLSWNAYFLNNLDLPLCELLSGMSYLRPYAGTYNMDLETNLFECDSFINVDILYSHIKSISEPFSERELSDIGRAGVIEGGPAMLHNIIDSSLMDIFMFTGNGDIWMLQNAMANQTGIEDAIRLPSPINPSKGEFNADNAYLERLGNTVVLVYEKYTDLGLRDFMYSLSEDNGNTWSQPELITTIDNSLGHIEHPSLYRDTEDQWWMYYSIDLVEIVRSKQLIPGDWDSWDEPEVILAVGNALIIGEPTVARNGDIAFSVGYINEQSNDTTDVYDLDPWYLPVMSEVNAEELFASFAQMSLYPNPSSGLVTLEISLPAQTNFSIVLTDETVREVYRKSHLSKKRIEQLTIDYSWLNTGVYLCQIEADSVTTPVD